ncbi:hypothetical protein N7540_013020 [Penicillium herquei]|nr:hypothetical protein N7540_013020 [Penicillium herquei]
MKYNWGTTPDFKVQRPWRRSRQTLTWLMLDLTYAQKFFVRPHGVRYGDLYEFQLTVNDTALITIYNPIPADLNSIKIVDKDDQGRYLVSARHAHTVPCVDGATGEVLWTLGRNYNDFSDTSDGGVTNFKW